MYLCVCGCECVCVCVCVWCECVCACVCAVSLRQRHCDCTCTSSSIHASACVSCNSAFLTLLELSSYDRMHLSVQIHILLRDLLMMSSLSFLLPPPALSLSLFLPPPPSRVVPGIFGNQLSYCIEVIRQMLTQALQSSDNQVWHNVELTRP